MAWMCAHCHHVKTGENGRCTNCQHKRGTYEPYTHVATTIAPAIIVYLLDCSSSMTVRLGKQTRIEVVNRFLQSLLRQMARRSTKGGPVVPRYRVAITVYPSSTIDVIKGVRTCTELEKTGMPRMRSAQGTNMAVAFQEAKRILESEIPKLPPGSPAPLVCHMTDGEFNEGGDPAPHAKAIMNMSTDDGNVLVENIYIKPNLTGAPITDARQWGGCSNADDLQDSYSQKLFEISSPLPDTYRSMLLEEGYRLERGCRMLFPGESSEFVELAFAASGATPLYPVTS